MAPSAAGSLGHVIEGADIAVETRVPVELTTVRCSTLGREEWLRLAHRVKLLSWFSLAYMTAEGAIAITAGVIASSPALIGFGLDSVIEGFASLIIVWRFTGARLLSERSEHIAQRLVAIQFFLFAPYIAYEGVHDLAAGSPPDISWIGIALASTSLVVMPWLGRQKQNLGARMGSVATQGEGRQNMLCAYLSAALLVGLLGNALVGAWWLDPIAALVIAGISVREGINSWRGEGCCAPTAPGLDPSDAPAASSCCDDDCC